MPAAERDELDSEFEYEDEQDEGTMQVRNVLSPPTATNITTLTLHCRYLLVILRLPEVYHWIRPP
jgi:hypothetical protein